MKYLKPILVISISFLAEACSSKCESPLSIFDKRGVSEFEFKPNSLATYEVAKLTVVDEKGQSLDITHLIRASYTWSFLASIKKSAIDSKEIFEKGLHKTYYFRHISMDGKVDVDTLTTFLRAKVDECGGSELIEEAYFYNGKSCTHTLYPFLITFEK